MDKDINYYLAAFEKMKRAIMRGVKDPHKPLLAIGKKRKKQGQKVLFQFKVFA